jgi:hypothetical protein
MRRLGGGGLAIRNLASVAARHDREALMYGGGVDVDRFVRKIETDPRSAWLTRASHAGLRTS